MSSRIKILLAFAAIYIVWGSTYAALRFGIKTIPGFLLSAIRFAVASLLLFASCLLRRKSFPVFKSFIIDSGCGVLLLGGGTVYVAWVEQYVPSSTAAS